MPEFALPFAIIPAVLVQIALTIILAKSENYIGAIIAIVSLPQYVTCLHAHTFATAFSPRRNGLPAKSLFGYHRARQNSRYGTERRTPFLRHYFTIVGKSDVFERYALQNHRLAPKVSLTTTAQRIPNNPRPSLQLWEAHTTLHCEFWEGPGTVIEAIDQ